MHKPSRGEIWEVDPDPIIGHELRQAMMTTSSLDDDLVLPAVCRDVHGLLRALGLDCPIRLVE